MDSRPSIPDLIEFVQDSVIVCSLDGVILSWNAAAECLYDRKSAGAVGQNIDVLGPQAEWDKARASAGFNDTGRWVGELPRQTASGRRFIASVRLFLRRDRLGTPVDLVETSSQVPAHDCSETALERSDQRYRDLFHAMPVAFWKLDFSLPTKMLGELLASGVKDLEAYLLNHPSYVRSLLRKGRILDFNQRAIEIFELAEHESPPTDFERFWPESAYPQFISAAIAAVAGARGFTAETRQLTMKGREFDALFTANFPADMAESSIFIVNVLDISDIKRGQAALIERDDSYRNLFEASAMSVWLLDKSRAIELLAKLKAEGVTDLVTYGRQNPGFSERLQRLLVVLDVNDTTLKLFGATNREQIVGANIERFWITGQDDAFLGGANAAFNEQPNFRTKTRMRSIDGHELHVLFTTSSSEYLRAAGHAFVIIVDITDQVNAEAALSDMRASYAHSARVSLLGELTATIAHEINQPLAAIRTNGEVGLRWLNNAEPDLGELRLLTEDIIADARRTADIVAGIRAMASPKAEPHHAISLNDLVLESLVFLRPQLTEAAVREMLELQSNLPDVLGDAVQIRQVLVNLIMNAIQAMSDTSEAMLLITTERSGSEIFLVLTDNGSGIEPEHTGRVFDNFFTTKPTGMGIGLPICRTIMESHGGTIEIKNAEPHGVGVTLRLPIAVPMNLH